MTAPHGLPPERWRQEQAGQPRRPQPTADLPPKVRTAVEWLTRLDQIGALPSEEREAIKALLDHLSNR